MSEMIFLKTALLITLGYMAYWLLSYVGKYKVLSAVADTLLEKAKEQEKERQVKQRKLLLIEGRQEKTHFLYRLDLLVLQSNLRRWIPFASTEILMILVILGASGCFAVVTSVSGTWIFGFFGFAAICLGTYLILYLMALVNYRKTEDGLLTFINLMENYSSTEDELIAIFSRIWIFLEEPIRSAVEQCCIEAEMTGDRNRAIRNLEKRIEHEKFKELIRNLEICSRYEANYAEVIKDSRGLLREYLAAKKERKAIFNNARIEIVMILACGGVVFWMISDFTQSGLAVLLLKNHVGQILLAYCIFMLCYAIRSVAFDRH